MGAFIIVAAVIVSAAVLSDAGRPAEQIDLDRVPPTLPENIAFLDSDWTTEHQFIAREP
jgi:hypothetical protein